MLLCFPLSLPFLSHSWNAGKKFMGNVDAFLKSLVNFDKDNVPGGQDWTGELGCGQCLKS